MIKSLKMKILHLPLWIPNKEDTQLGNFIQQQIDLTQIDHQIFSLSFISNVNAKKIEFNFTQSNSLTISYPKSTFKLVTFFFYLRAVQQSVSYLRDKYSFDLIHCHVAGRNLWFARRFFKNIPIVLSEHWSGFVNGQFNKLSSLQKNFLINNINSCNTVISVSPFLTKGLKDSGVKVKINEVGNVIDVKQKVDINNSKSMNFLVVADLVDPVKNISGIIKAINTLDKSHFNFNLTIAGDGKDLNFLKELVLKLKLEDRIQFLGRVVQEEVQQLLLKADCTIINSNFETFSMVALESILTGCPVICTSCGGPEQFINKSNGLLINTNDCNALAKAMVEIYQNKLNYPPELVRKSVVNTYSKDSIRKQLNTIYDSI